MKPRKIRKDLKLVPLIGKKYVVNVIFTDLITLSDAERTCEITIRDYVKLKSIFRNKQATEFNQECERLLRDDFQKTFSSPF